jgi:TonB family protein
MQRLAVIILCVVAPVVLALTPTQQLGSLSDLSSAIDSNGVRHTGGSGVRSPWMNDVTYAVPLIYPYSSRARHETGSGLLRLTLNLKNGNVQYASIVKSTGFSSLDYSAVGSFRRWRWKPGKWKEIEVPFTFALRTDIARGTYIGHTPLAPAR